MPIQVFKGKSISMAKGNTLKKPSPLGSPPEFHAAPPPNRSHSQKFEHIYPWNLRRSAYQNLGKKKGRTENSDKKSNEETKVISRSPGRRPSVMLRTLADPYHALLVKGGGLVKTTDMEQDTMSHEIAEATLSIVESPPDAEVAQRATEQPMLNLLLGRQDHSSHFFTQRYVRIPDNDLLPESLLSRIHSLEPIISCAEPLLAMDMDPHAYELFRIWSRTGTIPLLYRRSCYDVVNIDSKYTWQACWPLMNAVIAGYALCEPDFTDRAMDTLAQNVVRGVYADTTTINHLFSRDDVVPQVLQQFVVDRCIDSCIATLTYSDMLGFPLSFVDLMLQTTLQRLSRPKQVPLELDCTYHTHKALENCYKKRASPAELRKSARLELQREKSKRDVVEFIASHRDSSVKATDWEDRRIKARQARIKARQARIKARQARIKEWDDGMGLNNNPFRIFPESFATVPENELIEVEPNEENIPVDSDHLSTPSSALFGTAQTAGAVDEVRPEPPTRAALPPPGDLERATAYVVPTCKVDGDTTSPFVSSRSTQSTPDSELRRAVEMLIAYENRTSSCPGAFPESRVGSLRSTASKSGKADE